MFLWSPRIPNYTKNYVFSHIPELDSSESDRQGAGNFFFIIFLIFSAILQQKIPIFCTQIDNNYMFDMPGCQLPAPPRNTETEATSLCAWLCRSRLMCNQRILHLNDPADPLINIKDP